MALNFILNSQKTEVLKTLFYCEVTKKSLMGLSKERFLEKKFSSSSMFHKKRDKPCKVSH